MANALSFTQRFGSGRTASIAAALYDFASLLAIVAFVALVTMAALILLPFVIAAMVAGFWLANRRMRRAQAKADGWVIEGVAEER